jgi:hypothetical protein
MIEISRCDTELRDDCEDAEVIDDHAWAQYLDILMVDSYFDLESFDAPIKTYLTQKYFASIIGTKVKNFEVFLKENNIDRLDDYSFTKGNEQNSFYSVKEMTSDEYESEADLYASVKLSLDAESQNYSRNVYTILDVIGQVGGIFSLLTSFCALIVGIYAEKMAMHSILSKCYTLENGGIPKQDSDFSENVQVVQLLPEVSEEEKFNNDCENEGGSDEDDHSKVFPHEILLRKPKSFNKITRDYLSDKMKQRKRYNFALKDFFYGLFCCMKIRYKC